MTNNVFELNAFWTDQESRRKPLYVRISAPEPVPGEIDCYCLVHAPSIFREDKRIFGIDQEQAAELAVKFIRSMLEDKHIANINGRPYSW
jgi:hypothetical protein